MLDVETANCSYGLKKRLGDGVEQAFVSPGI